MNDLSIFLLGGKSMIQFQDCIYFVHVPDPWMEFTASPLRDRPILDDDRLVNSQLGKSSRLGGWLINQFPSFPAHLKDSNFMKHHLSTYRYHDKTINLPKPFTYAKVFISLSKWCQNTCQGVQPPLHFQIGRPGITGDDASDEKLRHNHVITMS